LAVKQVLAWIDQICDALIYLHSRRPPIIHRDVKPANIRLTPTGKAMLVDFGVAKRYSPDIKTTEGARAVTPGYSPIEQYGQSKTDLRADIYSLGATLYTLLTANRPPESIDLITGKPLSSPRQLNPAISPALERVILRAMELNAVNRYETVAQLRQAIKDVAVISAASADEQVAAPRGSITRPLGNSLSRPISTRPREPSYETAAKIDWVTIPAGEFLFGEERQKIALPEFQIARYPVTNEQYHYFLLANPQHPPPPGWRGHNFPIGKARHPVINVSHTDVIAFCRWLNCRLPTAEEWEKAARGTDGRTYPWGEAWEDGRYCNNYEARNSGTTPVDRYPEGASPYKVLDMAGNVWEWTASHHGSAWMNQLCGGSWRSFSGYAVRAAGRDRLLLDDRRDDLGFRCARST
jgi:serine/threonine-protein kinase